MSIDANKKLCVLKRYLFDEVRRSITKETYVEVLRGTVSSEDYVATVGLDDAERKLDEDP